MVMGIAVRLPVSFSWSAALLRIST